MPWRNPAQANQNNARNDDPAMSWTRFFARAGTTIQGQKTG
jgi:hypothetical protein